MKREDYGKEAVGGTPETGVTPISGKHQGPPHPHHLVSLLGA
jgi:hypothetical protein